MAPPAPLTKVPACAADSPSSCKYLIKDLEQCQRDKSGTLDKRSDDSLSHALDACSYLIAYKWPIVKQLGTSVQW